MQFIKNNAYAFLGAVLDAPGTTLTVATGQGDRFPIVAAPDFLLLTLQDGANRIEIVKVTARSAGADAMTVERAQEGTSALAWSIGVLVEARITAKTAAALMVFAGAGSAADMRAAIDVPSRSGQDASGTWDIDTKVTLTDAAADPALPAVGSSTTRGLLQGLRNFAKWTRDTISDLTDSAHNSQAIPDAADLDTYTTAGLFAQSSDAFAAAGSHYPAAFAGMLEVTQIEGTTFVNQRYTTYSGGGNATWTRSLYGGAWTSWVRLLAVGGGGVGWNIAQSGTSLVFSYNGAACFQIGSDGTIQAAGDVFAGGIV